MHLAVDAHGLPIRVLITSGAKADCTQAGALLQGLSADYLLADRGHDTNAIMTQAHRQGMTPVIPPRIHRIMQRDYDKYLYKLRRLVENTVFHLKRWRGIATRYAKNASSFRAAVQIRCLAL
jgi:transposase